jgi:2-iminobutanoate/2-iminopropanoate deaminase
VKTEFTRSSASALRSCAGTSLQNVMKCNIYCTTASHFATVNAI